MHTFTGEWDCVRFIGLFGLLVYFSMRSLNKPNKPVYFSMRSLTGHQDSVRFIGLFGLLVYLVYWFISPCTLSLESGIVSGLLIY